jgi:hypothetical protein
VEHLRQTTQRTPSSQASAGAGGSPADSKVDIVARCLETLTCSPGDFDSMTVEQRLRWVEEFQKRYGGSRDGNFQNWFNDVHASCGWPRART